MIGDKLPGPRYCCPRPLPIKRKTGKSGITTVLMIVFKMIIFSALSLPGFQGSEASCPGHCILIPAVGWVGGDGEGEGKLNMPRCLALVLITSRLKKNR